MKKKNDRLAKVYLSIKKKLKIISWSINYFKKYSSFNNIIYYLNSFQMLSVQSPGYAGMERLGAPGRAQLVSPSDDR